MPAKIVNTLNLSCPKCGADPGTSLLLNLNDLKEITCNDCSGTFSATEAAEEFEAKANAWQKVAEWISLAPAITD